MDEIVGKLSEAEYYKLALKMEEMQHELAKLKVKEQQTQLLEKDIDIMKLKLALHKQVIIDSRLSFDETKKSYEQFRDELSKTLGFELKDLVIDPYTFEAKKIK
jgi:hypothetical protein